MSVLGKKWIIQNMDENLSPMEKILNNRGLKNPDGLSELFDPFLFSDMQKSVDRILKALEGNERIIVFGDYDVDGITGTAILVHTLGKLGANVSYRLPHRVNDGYGLSEKFIDEFIEKDVKLLITVDCGISCKNEIKKALDNGIDTIITDHHTVPKEKPEAISILHPLSDCNYPFKGLTGAGVAFKLAHALLLYHDNNTDKSKIMPLMELAALGTVADLGPLQDENRLIVKEGLKTLADTKWHGLKKIMKMAFIKENDKIDSFTIGYRIAPRINAAGRIGDPYIALKLLLQEEENEKISSLGSKLEELNTNRKDLTENAIKEAEELFKQETNLPKILIAENPDWHVGIIGLIAGRLTENYHRPALIMQDFGETLIGSARSIDGFNIIGAITHCKEYLETFGGHFKAAGFNLKKENLPAFKEKISAYANENLNEKLLEPELGIDCELSPGEINLDLINELENLEPFGVGNQKPAFILRGLEPFFSTTVGRDNSHLKFTIKKDRKDFEVIAFRMGQHINELKAHNKIDLVFNLEKNVWNNREKIQLTALDFRGSED